MFIVDLKQVTTKEQACLKPTFPIGTSLNPSDGNNYSYCALLLQDKLRKLAIYKALNHQTPFHTK